MVHLLIDLINFVAGGLFYIHSSSSSLLYVIMLCVFYCIRNEPQQNLGRGLLERKDDKKQRQETDTIEFHILP